MPSRTDVPEYAEYLEKIEALVAVVNHRHGTPDWMPIDLKLRDDLDEAVASYKHYDVMMVNAMFDGMNLVAKEGPLVNERDGVSILSREHRRARGARRVRAVGQPVRRPGARRRDLLGADDVARGARAARAGAEGDRHLARSGRLDRRADRRHPREGARRAAASSALSRPRTRTRSAPGRAAVSARGRRPRGSAAAPAAALAVRGVVAACGAGRRGVAAARALARRRGRAPLRPRASPRRCSPLGAPPARAGSRRTRAAPLSRRAAGGAVHHRRSRRRSGAACGAGGVEARPRHHGDDHARPRRRRGATLPQRTRRSTSRVPCHRLGAAGRRFAPRCYHAPPHGERKHLSTTSSCCSTPADRGRASRADRRERRRR